MTIAIALNEGEVPTSVPADGRARDPTVVAEMMIVDHTVANQRLETLGITPNPNPLSDELNEAQSRRRRV